MKRAYMRLQDLYVKRFLKPQFDYLGKGFTVLQPWNVSLFGSPISLGEFANIITTSDHKVRLSIWSDNKKEVKGINIGNYCLICPGVRISAADNISIGDNCMLASNVYVTDCDWHGIYNRIIPGKNSPVRLEENVWVGDSAIICKGVTIGRNSIIGAGSLVTGNIPSNCIAAGNPARVVKELDPEKDFTTRADWFKDSRELENQIDELDRYMLDGNTIFGWLRSMIIPKKGD